MIFHSERVVDLKYANPSAGKYNQMIYNKSHNIQSRGVKEDLCLCCPTDITCADRLDQSSACKEINAMETTAVLSP